MTRRNRFSFLTALVAVALGVSTALAGDTTGWKRYHAFGGCLQFSYPPDLLSVKADSVRVLLIHSVPYRHYDRCDFSEDRLLDAFVDFALEMRLDPRPCVEVLKSRHPYAVRPRTYQRERFGPDSVLVDGDGIRQGILGTLVGFRAHESVEDCGQVGYYFHAAGDSTLIAHRQVIVFEDTLRALPGVITPEREESLFEDVLRSVSFPRSDNPRPPLNAAEARLDHKPPSPPVLRLDSIGRGTGDGMFNDSTYVSWSDAADGAVVLEVSGAADDRTPVDSLRYRVHFVDGDVPYGFFGMGYGPLGDDWPGSDRLIRGWNDDNTWHQEPFSFRVAATAVDLAGNESAFSNLVTVAHDGSPDDSRLRVLLKDPGVVRFVDPPPRLAFPSVPPSRPVAPDTTKLVVEEHPLPKRERPSPAFYRKYEHSLVTTMGSRREKWRMEPPRVDALRRQAGRGCVFRLGKVFLFGDFSARGQTYTLEVTPEGNAPSSEDARAKLVVKRNGEVIYETRTRHPARVEPVLTFYEWENGESHWVLEHWRHVVVDGWDLNERHGYTRTFFYRIVHGKPFYFADVFGKVRLCWRGSISAETYDDVVYATRGELAAFDPACSESMVWFYGRRGNRWYYVEAGVFE